jgi:branched-chain amino acid transport system substrate-binding protein
VTATIALGDTDDEAYQLYQAVMGTYGQDVQDVDNNVAMGGYTVMASTATALAGLEGDVTTETVAEAFKSMEESDYPGADGITFQCGGTVFPSQPAVCTNQSLRATLDAEGNLASFEAIDSSDAVVEQ